MIGTTAALLGSAAISGGASLLGGIFGGNAKKKAAQLQEQAYKGAAARTDQTTQAVNGDIIGAGNASAQQVRQAAGEATAGVNEATLNANRLQDPYRETGDQSTNLLTQGLQQGGDFNKTPTMADLQIDPGYEFRRQQAQKALEGSAAARGNALGGNAVGQILGLNSNLASQEYQNAFERFRNTTADRFNRLNLTAQRGMTAADTQGTNLIGAGKYAGDANTRSAEDAANFNNNAALIAGQNSINGTTQANDYLTGGAQARGAGIVGQSNSVLGGVNGAVNAFSEAMQQSNPELRNRLNLLKNPAAQYTTLKGIGGTGIG